MMFGIGKRPVAAEEQKASTTQRSESACLATPAGATEWYNPVLLGASTIGECAMSQWARERSLEVMKKLDPDAYLEYMIRYFEEGMHRFGERWRYADIVTVLTAAASLAPPRDYLEIGVRRGRSLAMVITQAPACHVVAVDQWRENYAGMSNPGPDFVEAEMRKLGFTGTIEFVSGNSHQVVPDYLANHPDQAFDLVTIDGDHSDSGAYDDLTRIMPRIRLGGVLVFDDITHPKHRYLSDTWQRALDQTGGFQDWSFGELGYGVACAVRTA